MDRVIHCSANLGCHPAEAFQHFVSNRLLEAWLTNVADVEPRVGGKYELFWNPADRENDSTIGCQVTAIEPGAFLAFEWKSPKQFKALANFSDPLTHVVAASLPCRTGRGLTSSTPGGGPRGTGGRPPTGRSRPGHAP